MEAQAAKPWGIITTIAWTVLAVVIGQGVALVVVYWWSGDQGMFIRSLSQRAGPVLALSTLIATPLQIAVLAAAARLRGPVGDYLALGSFRPHDFCVGLAAIVAVGIAIAAFGMATGQDLVTSFQIDTYASAGSLGWMVALGVAVVLFAPLGEEIMFRGFLYRGLVRSPDRPIVAIPVIAALWAALHLQYDWFGLSQVFVLGLLFGWLRWRSRSVILTFVLHALINLESSVETVIKVGWPF